MRRVFIFLIVSSLWLLFSCNTPTVDTGGYSLYKPVLMLRSELEQSVALRDVSSIDTVFKVIPVGNYLLVGEIYKGIHILDNTLATEPKQIGFISVPGIIDFVAKDSLIYANSAVDLVVINFLSGQVLDREKDVFPELLPPDGLKPNPRFVRGLRPEGTEIVAWKKDLDNSENSDDVIVPNYLFAIRGNYLYALVGVSLLIYDISNEIPEYSTMQKVNYNFNYKLKLLSDFGLFVSQSNMEVYAFTADDNLTYQNEYLGINLSTYFDVLESQDGYYLVASYHYFPLFWSLYNQLEVYYMGNFDRAILDTVIKLNYPLDVGFKDSLLFVCDGGIKIFKIDSSYSLVNTITSDAQNLVFTDSLVVSLGEQTISQYYIRGDSLQLLSSLPITMSWIVK